MIKHGDKVWIEGEVVDSSNFYNLNSDDIAVNLTDRHGHISRFIIRKEQIKKHIPAPDPIKVGDTVILPYREKERFRVIAIDHPYVWCRSYLTGLNQIIEISSLERSK